MPQTPPLKRGWTTGACACAASKAAYAGLLTGAFPDPVEIGLPNGRRVAFALARTQRDDTSATTGIVKDAGDDPDVTHGALVCATVRRGEAGRGVTFKAGPGVGTVTLPGLPVPPGEPAINPVPRQMIRDGIAEIAAAHGADSDVEVEISIPDGEALAQKTMNPRLGIIGGLSILGTTGIVVPYSCAAWIASIHQGIDVARATGIDHVAGAAGRTSEAAIQKMHKLPENALIDMGDFVGGMLKHLRKHPVPRVTVAGGVAKMSKLAQGMLDLHSKRGAVDLAALAELAAAQGASPDLQARIVRSNTTAEAFSHAASEDLALGDAVAGTAWTTAAEVLAETDMQLEITIFDREGKLVGHAPFAPIHAAPPERKRRT